MKASVLKPGLLVALNTSLRGGVQYQRVEIEPEHAVGDGTRARWETQREIANREEFDAATVARSKARSIIRGVCCPSSFGLLCPTDREDDLSAAIADARLVADSFNAGSTACRVEVYVMVGRIAQDDAEAARAIASEIRELMSDMQAGIQRANPTAIREAANKARALGAMLSKDVAGKVDEAIAQARRAAREIVRRVETAGESAADVVAQLSMSKIEAARFSFLDLDEQAEAPAPVAAVAPDLDFEQITVPPVRQTALSFELEV